MPGRGCRADHQLGRDGPIRQAARDEIGDLDIESDERVRISGARFDIWRAPFGVASPLQRPREALGGRVRRDRGRDEQCGHDRWEKT